MKSRIRIMGCLSVVLLICVLLGQGAWMYRVREMKVDEFRKTADYVLRDIIQIFLDNQTPFAIKKLNLTNFWMAKTLSVIKPYHGRIPACGVFCGGCPSYTRDEKNCQGAEENKTRCEKCRTFYLCCVEKGITHCYLCHLFPCTKFKGFTKRWLKYGQDFIENQKFLKQVGEMEFLRFYNEKVTD